MNSDPPVPASRKRRIFLVDDHPLVREGLTTYEFRLYDSDHNLLIDKVVVAAAAQ